MASTQPALSPKNANPARCSYYPHSSKVEWHVDQWRNLTADFDVRIKELPLWHQELSGTRAWGAIRLLYMVGPLFGEGFDADTLRDTPWQIDEVARKFGHSHKLVEADIKEAIKFWHKRRKEVPLEERILKSSTRPKADDPANPADVTGENAREDTQPERSGEPILNLTSTHQVTPQQIHEILQEAGIFTGLDDDKRLYAARRVLDLRRHFEDPRTRETARQIINCELNMRTYEEKLLGEKYLKPEDFTKLEQALTKLTEKHRDLIGEIGADEAELDGQRSVALDTYSSFARGMQEWYGKNERTLIDGIFTAEEATWLLTPAHMREAQYPSAIVIRMKEALLPENLWAPDYEPTPIQREACRALLQITRKVGEELFGESKEEEVEADTPTPDTQTDEDDSEKEDAARIPSFTRRLSNREDDDEPCMVTS